VAKWVIEPLAKTHHRDHFDCGKEVLSEWLKRYANQNMTRDLSRTYVAVRPGTTLVFGYYSLSAYRVQFDDLPNEQAKHLPRFQNVPLLGRLAVDRNVQGQGLGAILLVNALGRTARLADELGIHAVVVHAIDDSARAFYLKHDFIPLLDNPLHLFIPMKVVRKLRVQLD
jgi:GNAT superfamily N-acetyltransferase